MSTIRLLKATLWVSAIVEFIYFSCSHWFFHRAFFNALGIHGADLESPFVMSQLQLIGAMVMGYSLINIVIASDPIRYRPMIGLLVLIGSICISIFIVNVWMKALPAPFLVNAALLAAQVVLLAINFPPRTPRGLL